jgi:calnexin
MFLFLLHVGTPAFPVKPATPPFHFESFSAPTWDQQWQPSALENYTGIWELRDAPDPASYPGEKLIFAAKESAYHGLGTKFPKPLNFRSSPLIVQYEVRFVKDIICGGAYIKLFGDSAFDPLSLSNETKYTIMFGPDKCGSIKKVHFIFMHAHPHTGVFQEKHLESAPEAETDKINHLYTLIVRPDNTYTILIDGVISKGGSLLNDFEPPVNPPLTIDDPTDTRPDDWVDEEMIDDPDARKPEDWDDDAPEYVPDPDQTSPPEDWQADEPRFIPDPDAIRPDDWDRTSTGNGRRRRSRTRSARPGTAASGSRRSLKTRPIRGSGRPRR